MAEGLVPQQVLIDKMAVCNNRFKDENLSASDFYNEVDVVCPACNRSASAKADYTALKARLLCLNCFYDKEISVAVAKDGWLQAAAHSFFRAALWLQHPFKNDVFWACNQKHLQYLEAYIAAGLREHTGRTHFTLLEKLPRVLP